ncbi:MAG: serine/threonine-protein kinase [Thermoanaerobaculaceae bacterium]
MDPPPANTPADEPRLPRRWRPIRLLGSGGQADVWLVEDRQLGGLAALKVLRGGLAPESRRRLLREVNLGRDLSHPHLVRVFDLVELDECVAVSMEWVAGGTLQRLARQGPLPVPDVVRIADEALKVLAYLHSRNIVHRDVKPSNLLLDENGHVRLADLGLALVLKDRSDATQTRMCIGTPAFMSPEQRSGGDLTPASDLYSLGLTLFLLLTGRSARLESGDSAPGRRHSAGYPPNPRRLRSDCPQWLARFVVRLLEDRPDDRWPDAQRAHNAFCSRRAGLSPRRSRRALLGSAIGLALTASLSVLGTWGWRASHQTSLLLTTQDTLLVAADGSGAERWRHDLGTTIRQVEEVDLDGDGSREILVAGAAPGSARTPHPPSAIAILDRRGRTISRINADNEVSTAIASTSVPIDLVPHLVAMDIDEDGRPEILALCRHRILASSFLLAYWPSTQTWRVLLQHAGGWVFNVARGPRDGKRRVRFFAFNSTIGSFPVVGELLVPPPGTAQPISFGAGPSGVAVRAGTGLSFYTPLEPAPPSSAIGSPGFECDPSGGMAFTSAGRSWRIDTYGNPTGSPAGGHETGGRRVAVLRELDETASRTGVPGDIFLRRSELVANNRDLLSEPPMRAVMSLMVARALAAAGDLPAAIAELEPEWRSTHWDGLGLALAHLQAVHGDVRTAAATLRATVSAAITPAGTFRAPELLSRVAIELGDRRVLADILAARGDLTGVPVRRRVIEARARLWWDQASEADTSLASDDLVPEGEAVACLVRWRLGRTRADDPEVMIDAARRSPDAAIEATIARAASLLALGRPAEALDLVEGLEQPYGTEARWDFRKHQLVGLARALRCMVLARLGRQSDAREAALSLRPALRPGLLPRILVDEVLKKSPEYPPTDRGAGHD